MTAAATPTGCMRDTFQTELGKCPLPLYRCRCSEDVKNVHEWRHGYPLGPVEGVDAVVMTADIRS
jgi:hypothetical protein